MISSELPIAERYASRTASAGSLGSTRQSPLSPSGQKSSGSPATTTSNQ
jgi:hypothetical protein